MNPKLRYIQKRVIDRQIAALYGWAEQLFTRHRPLQFWMYTYDLRAYKTDGRLHLKQRYVNRRAERTIKRIQQQARWDAAAEGWKEIKQWL